MCDIVSELPVMNSCCKTCPFIKDSDGRWQNEKLASEVIQRNIFQSQQICHGTQSEEDNKTVYRNRCKGYYDYAFEIYSNLGMNPGKNFKNSPTEISSK